MSKGRNGGRDFQQLESDVMFFFFFFSGWNTDCIGGRATALHMEHTRLPPRLVFLSRSFNPLVHIICSPVLPFSSPPPVGLLPSSFFASPLQSAMGLSQCVCVRVCVFRCHFTLAGGVCARVCLTTPRWRVNALLTYALTADEQRLSVAAGGRRRNKNEPKLC